MGILLAVMLFKVFVVSFIKFSIVQNLDSKQGLLPGSLLCYSALKALHRCNFCLSYNKQSYRHMILLNSSLQMYGIRSNSAVLC